MTAGTEAKQTAGQTEQVDVIHSMLTNVTGTTFSADNFELWLRKLNYGQLCLLEMAVDKVKRQRRERVLNACDGERLVPSSWSGSIDELISDLEANLSKRGIDIYA